MKKSPSNSLSGFTLVEMLVSMAVLTLLIVLVTQLINSATVTTTASRKHMDADSQARMVFDRMAIDFNKMLKRSDVDYIVKGWSTTATMPGNDAMFFFSEAPAYFNNSPGASAQSPVSLIGYRVNPGDPTNAYVPKYSLERLGKGLAWDGAAGGSSSGSVVFLTRSGSSAPLVASTIAGNWPAAAGTAPNYTNGTDPDYHVLGDQVFRLEYCYLLKPYLDATGKSMPATYTNVPYNNSDANHTSVNGFQDVSEIVVAIAILDANSRKITSNLSSLAAALTDPGATDLGATPPRLMAELWTNAINKPDFANTAGIPQAAASQVRVYQRHFYLNNN